MNAATDKLLALFSNQLLVASDFEEDRMEKFSWTAKRFGDFLPPVETDHFTAEPPEGRNHNALCMYRDATESQRDGIDRVLSLQATSHSYWTIMKALHNENRGQRKGSFDLIVSVYENIHSVGAGLDAQVLGQTIEVLPESFLKAKGEKAEVNKVLLSALVMCASDNSLESHSMRGYLSSEASFNAKATLVCYSDGLLTAFSKEHVKVFSTYPSRWQEIASAMQRADRILSADELKLVATGTQPVALVEGLL